MKENRLAVYRSFARESYHPDEFGTLAENIERLEDTVCGGDEKKIEEVVSKLVGIKELLDKVVPELEWVVYTVYNNDYPEGTVGICYGPTLESINKFTGGAVYDVECSQYGDQVGLGGFVLEFGEDDEEKADKFDKWFSERHLKYHRDDEVTLETSDLYVFDADKDEKILNGAVSALIEPFKKMGIDVEMEEQGMLMRVAGFWLSREGLYDEE